MKLTDKELQMAKKAGLHVANKDAYSKATLDDLLAMNESPFDGYSYTNITDELAKFAELIRADSVPDDMSSTRSFDLAMGLNYIAEQGYWPSVIYDDDGNWCIVDEGRSNVRINNNDDFHYSMRGQHDWFKPTLEEAWNGYMGRLQELWNDIDFDCAYRALAKFRGNDNE